MYKKTVCLTLFITLLTLAAPTTLQAAFVEEIAADFSGNWTAITMDFKSWDKWHRQQPTVAALGFEVTVGDWPALIHRTFLDYYNGSMVYTDYNEHRGWMDLGQIITSGTASPQLTDSSWCYRKYTFGSGGDAMTMYVSRLTPAVLCQSDSSNINLFAGSKWVKRNGTYTTVVPKYVAYHAGGQVHVDLTGSTVSLSGLDEPWVLFFYGDASYLSRNTLPNIFDRMQALPLNDPPTNDWYFPDADLPVLVVFDKKPQQVSPTSDSLRLTFSNGVGSVSIVPPLGMYHPLATETEGWSSGLPGSIANKCTTWARRLKSYPLTCSESREINEAQDNVKIKYDYTYIDLPDEWSTSGIQVAPVPPVGAIGINYGGPVMCSGTLAADAIATHSGPYTGVADANTATLTISGLNKYVNEMVDSPAPSPGDAQDLANELADEISNLANSPMDLAPASCYVKKHSGRDLFYFANPGETILAVAEALPYLGGSDLTDAVDFVVNFISYRNPLTTTGVARWSGPRREYSTILTLTEQIVHSKESSYDPPEPVTEEERANNAYALWAFGKNSGRWDVVSPLWGTIKSTADYAQNRREWATCGYFTTRSTWDGGQLNFAEKKELSGVQSTTGQLARWVAMARMASQFSDTTAREHAMYMLARTALLRLAQGYIVQYIYDENIQTITEPSDWMKTYSTATGENGHGTLWTDDWAGYEGDVRQAIRWDEFGPVIHQVYAYGWHPVMAAFENMTPECGRFLADHASGHCTRFIQTVEWNAPAWYSVRNYAYLGIENTTDNPRHPFQIFMGKCYVQGTAGSELVKCQDMPFVKVGDLYHMRKVAANLRAFGGLQWVSSN